MGLFGDLFRKPGSTGLPKAASGEQSPAAFAVNQLGIDLHRRLSEHDQNLFLSAYSIEVALAMTWAGAEGETHAEMAKALHFVGDEDALHASFALLAQDLERVVAKTVELARQARDYGGPSEPILLAVANRLFPQRGYKFRAAFLSLVEQRYRAPLEPLDYVREAAAATEWINRWVEAQTHERIKGLIPPGALDEATRLVIANAIYFKAPWANEFSDQATARESFRVCGREAVIVPTMRRVAHLGFAKEADFTALTIPYFGDELQFLILLPDDVAGLPALEAKLTAETLGGCAKLDSRSVDLHLPKFRLEPPTVALAPALKALGMRAAFGDQANFDRMAPRTPKDYLLISEVFHKTFIVVDEKGTEAAAATAVVMVCSGMPAKPDKPIVVRVDHPFVFAIQHRPSGACLFLGRIVDPR